MNSFKSEKISIIGSGLIGRGFAMLFASVGYQVYMYDVNQDQVSEAMVDIKRQLIDLEKTGTLKGKLSAEEQMSCIHASHSLEDCLNQSIHAQECVPESLELKTEVFKKMDAVADPGTVLSSSTSCIMPSKFTEGLKNRANCIVSHPFNPPYYIRAIEVIPAPWTAPDVMQRTCELLTEISLLPIKFLKEYPGFASNRIQYSILNACWHLVQEGVLSVEDVDNLMKEGLAMRYVWCGPFETIHLNANGTADYIKKYGSTIHRISKTLLPPPTWDVSDASTILDEINAKIPENKLKERRNWRDERLMALSKLKTEMNKN